MRQLSIDVQWAYPQKAGHRADKASSTVVDNKTGRVLEQFHAKKEHADQADCKCLGKGNFYNFIIIVNAYFLFCQVAADIHVLVKVATKAQGCQLFTGDGCTTTAKTFNEYVVQVRSISGTAELEEEDVEVDVAPLELAAPVQLKKGKKPITPPKKPKNKIKTRPQFEATIGQTCTWHAARTISEGVESALTQRTKLRGPFKYPNLQKLSEERVITRRVVQRQLEYSIRHGEGDIQKIRSIFRYFIFFLSLRFLFLYFFISFS